MSSKPLIEQLARTLSIEPEALRRALDELDLDVAKLGEHHPNYFGTQHEAFLRGVENAAQVLSGDDEYGEHAATIDESQQIIASEFKIPNFEQTQIGKAVSAILYRGH